ncbi:MAG: PEGA domain-containing protein [Pseudomonadota bacterium]
MAEKSSPVRSERVDNVTASRPLCPKLALVVVLALAVAATAHPASVWADEGKGDVPCVEPIDGAKDTRRARAAEHYRRGQELYAAGDYELAVPEFLAAYCLVPVPEALYNIGQAYERVVDYEEAVLWFDRYVRILPATSTSEKEAVSHRLAVLRRLPSRLHIATVPPGAEITLAGADTSVHGIANAKEPLRVPAGSYTLLVELAGYEPIREAIRLDIGQPYTFSFHLQPRTGRVRITTDPQNARILIDRKLVGFGLGQHIDSLPEGEHEILVEATGRPSKTEKVMVTANTMTSVHVKLDKMSANGRNELLIAATVGGLVGVPFAETAISNPDQISPVLILAGGVAGFGIPYLLLPQRVPVGRSSFVIGSTLWGLMEGTGIAETAGAKDVALLRIALSGGIAGALFSALTARRFDLSAGDAALINSGGMWGTFAGILFLNAFNEGRGPLLLAGLNCGLLAGVGLANHYEISRRHMALIDLAGITGTVVGWAVADALEESGQGDRAIHLTLGGMAAGLVAGVFYTRRFDSEDGGLQIMPGTGVAIDAAGKATAILGANGTF